MFSIHAVLNFEMYNGGTRILEVTPCCYDWMKAIKQIHPACIGNTHLPFSDEFFNSNEKQL